MDQVTTTARFLVVREQPMVAVDIHQDRPALPLLEDGLYRRVVEAGLVELPAFWGVDLPRGARVGWTLDGDDLQLVDESDNAMLKVRRADMDPVWEAAALRLRGTMFVIGHRLDLGPDQTHQQVCEAVDTAARAGRLAGAIVGVAEPRTGLPLIF